MTNPPLAAARAVGSPIGVATRSAARSIAAAPVPILASFLILALALRAVSFGNPLVQIDVQFYALVGDRMLSGALPYVDIWDRKPIGLFALFAGLQALGRVFGTEGPLPYQLAASLCAGATAFVIERIARNFASGRGAWLAGLCYLVWLAVFNCVGAQTPVFYNLLMALAALGTLRLSTRFGDRALVSGGVGVMLLVGLALQLKYCVVFEGICFGLMLLACAHADALTPRTIAAYGATWIAAALAPTLLALAAYAVLGQAGAFVDANFMSIFRRHDSDGSVWTDLLTTAALLFPFGVAICFAARRPTGRAYRFVADWALAAILGYLVFGTYYDHYAAPLLVPLCVLAAPALGRTGRAAGYTVLLLGTGLVVGGAMTLANLHTRGNAQDLERTAALIRPQLKRGCLYVYEGDPALYQATHSGLPGKYVFPSHIDSAVESRTIDQPAELRRVLARRPTVIVTADQPLDSQPSLDTRAILRHALAHDYRRFGEAMVGTRRFLLYRRNG